MKYSHAIQFSVFTESNSDDFKFQNLCAQAFNQNLFDAGMGALETFLREALEGKIESPCFLFIAAKKRGGAVPFAVCLVEYEHKVHPSNWIQTFVSERARGEGYGREIVQRMEKEASRRGIQISGHSFNKQSSTFYKKVLAKS